MLSSVAENRLVEAKIESPTSIVFRLAQKLWFAQLSGHIVVEMALEGLLEGLHANRDLGMDRMKTANDLQLNQMVIETIMGLADQNHPPVGKCGNQRLQI